MLALKFLKPLRNPQQAEGDLEMKCLEDSEGMKWDRKGSADVHRGMKEAGVLKWHI